MIGVDTNVLLRWLVQDSASIAEQELAAKLLNGKRFHISNVVFIETLWLLSRYYKFPKQQIQAFIETLLQEDLVTVQGHDLIAKALSDWKQFGGDLPDHVLARQNEAAGCGHTVTFDKKAGRSPLFEVHKA